MTLPFRLKYHAAQTHGESVRKIVLLLYTIKHIASKHIAIFNTINEILCRSL